MNDASKWLSSRGLWLLDSDLTMAIIAGSSQQAARHDMNAGDRGVPVSKGQALAAIAEGSQPDSHRAFPNAWWWMKTVGLFVSSPTIRFHSV
jgi:hypothetical protein